MKSDKKLIISAICISIGLIVIGVCINKGLQSITDKNRVVTVKGLAEKNIKATDAAIKVYFYFTGDNPNEIMETITKEENKIISIINSKGYDRPNISDMDIYDSKSYYEDKWNGERMVTVKRDRYRVSKTIIVEISDVEKAENKANDIKIDLISKGISSCEVSCIYNFPELNDIKPELIAESTKNARIAGEQFANDSQSKLGKIKVATQGQISIAGQYYEDGITSAPQEPYLQKVRVVSTIIFFLED